MKTTPHDRALERLPWLINGTLDDEERRELEEHLAGCRECRSELLATRRAFDLHSAHLPARVLVAYAETAPGDRLRLDGEPIDRATVEEHLALCDDCREELAMVRESRAALGATADEDAAGLATVTPFARPAVHREARAGWLPLALAASLLLAAVSVGGWYTSGRQGAARVAELERELAAQSEQLRGTPQGGEAERLAELQRELAAARARGDEMAANVAALEERVAAALAAQNPPPAALAFVSADGVLRGGEAAPTQVAADAGGLRLVVFLAPGIAARGPFTYRVTAGDGVLLRGDGPLAVEQSEIAGPFVDLRLPAGLPAGRDLVLRLLHDGDEVASVLFRLDGER